MTNRIFRPVYFFVCGLVLAALSACSTTMNMDYKGPVQSGSLAGKVFALDTTASKEAQFPPMPGCPFVANATCRHWVMQERQTLLSYNQVLASALMQSGAKPTGDDAQADFIVKTVIAPAPGQSHVIDDHYLFGKSVALGGLTGERYIEQTIHAVYHVTIERHGHAIAKMDIPVDGEDQVKWGTFADANDLDIVTRESYRKYLRTVVTQVMNGIMQRMRQI